MKKSITIASLAAVGSSVAGVAALPTQYFGSDTLFNVTRLAITNIDTAISPATIGAATQYLGGGSGTGDGKMAGTSVGGNNDLVTQQTAPMSRMIKNESSTFCAFNQGDGGAGSGFTSASGIVIGLDAVDVLSSSKAAGQAVAGCGAAAANGITGVYQNGTTNALGDGENWKWALALLYGGLDYSTCAGHGTTCAVPDCNSTARHNLINNWATIFGGACTKSATTGAASTQSANSICSAAPISNQLWHAFRRDDTSGTADTFASLTGINSPSGSAMSSSSLNGFGISPYCNALNWDSSTANANCSAGVNKQLLGPGGIFDPSDTTGVHKKPPTGTYGDAPQYLGNTAPPPGGSAWDVLPTQMQDNDPIRRPCLGSSVNNNAHFGDEVCNLDGNLGVVLSMVDTDWIIGATFNGGPALGQYATGAPNGSAGCDGTYVPSKAPQLFTCPVRFANKHDGECPSGDSEQGGTCQVPGNSTTGTTACIMSPTPTPTKFLRTPIASHGRAYNLWLTDGTLNPASGAVTYAQYPIPALTPSGGSPPGVDMGGAYNRIHQVQTMMLHAGAVGCQMKDMTDQIGCLAAADPCSIGFAADEAANWQAQTNGYTVAPGDGAGFWLTNAVSVAGVVPSETTAQALGTSSEYQLSRKLYFNTLFGFGNIALEDGGTSGTGTTNDPTAQNEITLAQYESDGGFINPILHDYHYFVIGSTGPLGTGAPFCEDFNEQTNCGASANVNGCTNNNGVAGIPGENGGDPVNNPVQSTVCGNGKVEAYEECDKTARAGVGGCSKTCRCNLDYNVADGGCN
jgi:hypothetical protein